jgi:DNA-binding transcriptional LysR family regulator
MRCADSKSASASVSPRVLPAALAPTEAGEQLIRPLGPALGEVQSVLDQIVELRERPTGRVRLLVTPLSSSMVLAPKLVEFRRRFPDVVLEVATTQEGRTELVAAGFDAGIHLGESIQRDMVAVRVSRDQRLAVVSSPEYFAAHPKPNSPHDLPGSPMHQPARRFRGTVSLGVRERR